LQIYTISKDGALFHWVNATYADLHGSDDEMMEVDEDGNEIKRVDRLKWRVKEKHFFNQPGVKVNEAQFFAASNLVVVGFTNGLFGIYEVPHFTTIHTLR
jgi:periodic tryptophan protein 2